MKKQKSAFSFIEISIVLLIISIATAGVIISKKIIRQGRVANAQKQTTNSPAKEMESVFLWFDATSELSFIENEILDTIAYPSNDGISIWYDLNPNPETRKNATAPTSSNQPHYYSDCINHLPCLRFDGTNDYFTLSAEKLANNDYSIFVVEQKRKSGLNPIIGRASSPSANSSIEIGYDANDKFFLAQGGQLSNAYDYTPSPAISSNFAPHLHSIVNSSATSGSSNASHYYDGSTTASSANLTGGGLSSLSSCTDTKIGVNNNGSGTTYYQGDIGEIIIFNKPLSAQERRSVEEYLLNKWHIKRRD